MLYVWAQAHLKAMQDMQLEQQRKQKEMEEANANRDNVSAFIWLAIFEKFIIDWVVAGRTVYMLLYTMGYVVPNLSICV